MGISSDTALMKLSGHEWETSASRMATARYDCEPISRSSSGGSLTMILRIPLGYEDEAGFHCGEPQVNATAPAHESENIANLKF
jgi:hypothetical protein